MEKKCINAKCPHHGFNHVANCSRLLFMAYDVSNCNDVILSTCGELPTEDSFYDNAEFYHISSTANHDDRIKEVMDMDTPTETLTKTQQLISETCDRLKELLLNKNRKYGDSAINPVRIFSKASVIDGINIRLDDKINRKMADQFDDDEDIDVDIAGYLILKMVAKTLNKG